MPPAEQSRPRLPGDCRGLPGWRPSITSVAYGLVRCRRRARDHVTRSPRVLGVDPQRFGAAGDGAGGNLAAVLCRIARDAGDPARSPSNCFSVPSWTLHHDLRRLVARAGTRGSSWTAKPSAPRSGTLCAAGRRTIPSMPCRPCARRASDACRRPPHRIPPSSIRSAMVAREACPAPGAGLACSVHGRCHPGMIRYFYCILPRMIPYAAEAMRIIGTEIRYRREASAIETPERRLHRRIRPELVRA